MSLGLRLQPWSALGRLNWPSRLLCLRCPPSTPEGTIGPSAWPGSLGISAPPGSDIRLPSGFTSTLGHSGSSSAFRFPTYILGDCRCNFVAAILVTSVPAFAQTSDCSWSPLEGIAAVDSHWCRQQGFPHGSSLHPLHLGPSSCKSPGSFLHPKHGFSLHLHHPGLICPFHHPSAISVSTSQSATHLPHLCASVMARDHAYQERALCYT